MLKNLKSVMFGALALFAVASHADETKKARKGDVASEYVLKDNGDLFRIVNGNKCQVTNGVQSMKVSQHPNDVAVLYYAKDGDLWLLRDDDAAARPCPKTNKGVLLKGVKKYTVVSSTDTTIVNLALGHDGTFKAWDNRNEVLRDTGVEDYVHHGKYNVQGAAFSSYVAFAIGYDGTVLKVKGQNPGESKFDKGRKYKDLQQFKALNNIQ